MPAPMCLTQVSATRKAELMAQKREEKAAKEKAKVEKDMRSYKHIMQVFCGCLHVLSGGGDAP